MESELRLRLRFFFGRGENIGNDLRLDLHKSMYFKCSDRLEAQFLVLRRLGSTIRASYENGR